MKSQIKRTMAILIAVCFVLSITAATVSAAPPKKSEQTKQQLVVGQPQQQQKQQQIGLSGIIATPSSGAPPLDVAFTASVSSTAGIPPSGYSWDFGDGSTGTGPAPTHTYNNPGIYTVKLKTTDNNGGMIQVTNKVTVEGALVDFTITTSPAGVAPYLVIFKPIVSSSSTITSYDWDFGDGSHDYNKVPAPHEYEKAGSYTVSFAVTTGGATLVESKPGFITVT